MKNITTYMKDKLNAKHKRKINSEAVIILTLGALLLFLISSMTISTIYKAMQPKNENQPSIVKVEKDTTAKGLIVIDPGHGGYDDGCSEGDIKEKDITLQLANVMGAYLEANHYQVVYTRESDVSVGEYELVDLENRVNVGINNDADYFISLHLNFTDIVDERVYGYEVYANEAMEASMKLANLINTTLADLNYTDSRGVRDGSILHVVYNNPIPSALVEVGFLDDEEDRAYITSEAGIKNIGEAVAKAVIESKP